MKTVTKLTAAAVLAIAAAAPAFAQNGQYDGHAMRDTQTMAQTHEYTDAYASAPLTHAVHDPAASAFEY